MTKKKTPSFDTVPARHDALGRQLRLMYDSFTKEPLPDDLVELLGELDEKLKKSSNGPDDNPPSDDS
jgi:hypothetical protein